MRSGGGRSKGAHFERDVAKLVIAAFEPFGIKPEECFRAPLSGGHWAVSKTDAGDLQFSARLAGMFPYSVECKSYRALKWNELLELKSVSQFNKWWKQASKAASKVGRPPLLVCHQNGGRVWAVLPYKGMKYGPLAVRPMLFTTLLDEAVVVVPFEALLDQLVRAVKHDGVH